MRGDFILKILETVEDAAISMVDLFEVISSSGYGASRSKLEYELSKQRGKRAEKLVEREFKRQQKQKYYNFIRYLKKNGLIDEKKNEGKKILSITKKGREKFLFLKKQNKDFLPEILYQKEEGSKFIIIIFDIPEIDKRKRNWLRAVLRNLEFKMIQKSVWMGKIKIPKDFLSDLHEINLVNCVEIFEISKTGSLERLI